MSGSPSAMHKRPVGKNITVANSVPMREEQRTTPRAFPTCDLVHDGGGGGDGIGTRPRRRRRYHDASICHGRSRQGAYMTTRKTYEQEHEQEQEQEHE